jgi:hypothetical protein
MRGGGPDSINRGYSNAFRRGGTPIKGSRLARDEKNNPELIAAIRAAYVIDGQNWVEIGRRFNLPRSPTMGLAQTRRTIGGP